MQAILRESLFGQIVNAATKGRVLPHPEQRTDFVVPPQFVNDDRTRVPSPDPTMRPERIPGSKTESATTLTDKNDTAKRIGINDNTVPNSVYPPTEIEDGKDRYLVGWYSEDDPENPQYAISQAH